jgi:hypothetical protein
MFRANRLGQQWIGRWLVGLLIAAALVASSIAFDGFGLIFATEQNVVTPSESIVAAPTGNGGTLEGMYQTPWERYHCSGCP